MNKISKVCIIFAVLASVNSVPRHSVPRHGWSEININLRRAVRSAYSAAKDLGVTYISMVKAYEKKDTGLNADFYWVSFVAESMGQIRQECQAYVMWMFRPRFRRVVYGASCWPIY